MLIFLDTEFTGLIADPQLISIGLVTLDGQEFYAELSNIDLTDVDFWIEENVLPQLGHVPTVDRKTLKTQLLEFLQKCRGDNPTIRILFDYEGDIDLFRDILGKDWPEWLLHKNISYVILEDETDYPGRHHALNDAKQLRQYFLDLPLRV